MNSNSFQIINSYSFQLLNELIVRELFRSLRLISIAFV